MKKLFLTIIALVVMLAAYAQEPMSSGAVRKVVSALTPTGKENVKQSVVLPHKTKAKEGEKTVAVTFKFDFDRTTEIEPAVFGLFNREELSLFDIQNPGDWQYFEGFDAEEGDWTSLFDGVTVRVVPGTYEMLAQFTDYSIYQENFVIKENVSITEDCELVFDVTDAVCEVSVESYNPSGERCVLDYYTSSGIKEGNTAEMYFVTCLIWNRSWILFSPGKAGEAVIEGSSMTGEKQHNIKINPVSKAYTYIQERISFAKDWNENWVTVCAINGIEKSVTLSNDYHNYSVPYNFRFSMEPEQYYVYLAPSCNNVWHPGSEMQYWVINSPSFTFSYQDANKNPMPAGVDSYVAVKAEYEEYMGSVDSGWVNLSGDEINIPVYNYQCNPAVSNLACVDVDGNAVYRNYPGNSVFSIEGSSRQDSYIIGGSVPYMVGWYAPINSTTSVAVGSSAFGSIHDCWNSLDTFPGGSYALYFQHDDTELSGTMGALMRQTYGQDGNFSIIQDYYVPVSDEKTGHGLSTATYSFKSADCIPPQLQCVQIREANGVVANSLDSSRGATLTIGAGDYDWWIDNGVACYTELSKPVSVSVSIVPEKDEFAGAWTPLEVNDIEEGRNEAGFGYIFRSELPELADGWYSLKITVTDEAGNSTKQILSPAFRVGEESGVREIADDELTENSDVYYFNLQGIRVENPAHGIYIRCNGNRMEKVIVK